jgi:hypothetical protein
MPDVQGRRLVGEDIEEGQRKLGDFQFRSRGDLAEVATRPPDGTELLFSWQCLRNPGMICSVRVGCGFKPDNGRPSWSWNGDLDRPTLRPSINCHGCGWHGGVLAGVLVEPYR